MNMVHSTQTVVRRSGAVPRLGSLRLDVRATESETALAAALWLAAQVRRVAAAQTTVSLAFSGGRTPAALIRAFAACEVPWSQVTVFQVDERLVPTADLRRNAHQLEPLRAKLDAPGGSRLRLMAPDSTGSPSEACHAYEQHLGDRAETGVDIVHLGLGDDGHTASLVPGDPVLSVDHASLAITGEYQGTQRLTMTYPLLQRSGQILWLATGSTKAGRIAQLLQGDPSIPAGALSRVPGVVFCDRSAVPADLAGLMGRSPSGSTPIPPFTTRSLAVARKLD
jgi:6-phosphogluconolactonase